MKLCKILDCNNNHLARGWCGMHYARWQRHGDPIEKHGRWDNHAPEIKICSMEGCENKMCSRKLCGKHRMRLHRRGDPNISLPHYRKYSFNEQILDTWTKESAYLLGWIASDGYVRDIHSPAVVISLKDREPLESMKIILDHPKELDNYGGKWQLRVHSRYLVERLKKIGICSPKSLNIELPDIPPAVFSHFIRGVVEGDGSLTPANKYFRVSINSASELFLSQIRDALLFRGSLYVTGIKTRKNPLWKLVYSGMEAKKLSKWMYQDSEKMRLTRKYQRHLAAA